MLIYRNMLVAILALMLVSQPLVLARAQDPAASDQQIVEESDDNSDDHSEIPDDFSAEEYTEEYWAEREDKVFVSSNAQVLELANLDGPIELSVHDRKAIEENRVDVRVVDYLKHLATPIELGGAGLTRIKAQRILRHYDTSGRGKYDRETLDAIGEEDEGILSDHHSGQAVDISEVGEITCKLVERRHLGGNKTRWQQPRAVKVAWQSRDGISRHPTPKGPSVLEVTGAMTTAGILQMLNDSGEMSYFADFAKGLSLEEILLYVGANILVKELGGGQVSFDPRSDSLLKAIGSGILTKGLPDLPEGTVIASGDQSFQTAIARAHIEELLGLPPGSLRGEGWHEILNSTGKRTIENSLGLPALYFETHSLQDATSNEAVKTILNNYKKGDNAFATAAGAIEKIINNDEEGLTLAGVSLLSDALRLSEADRQALLEAAKAKTSPNINLASVGVDREVPVAILVNLFSQDPSGHQKALDQLEQYGFDFVRQLAVKGLPNDLHSIADGILKDVIQGERVNLSELMEQLGVGAISLQSDVQFSSIEGIAGGGNNSRASRIIAELLSEQLELEGNNILSREDVTAMLQGQGETVLEKIGGTQADKTLGWNSGTGAQLIRGEIELEAAFQQIFANSIGGILGLDEGTNIALDGDIHLNYGLALTEQRIGLEGGTLTKVGSYSQLTNEQKQLFGSNADEWKASDIRLGVPVGTTESFVNGGVSSSDLAKRVGTNSFALLAVDQVWNYFDLDETMRIKKEEAELLINTLINWNNAGVENKTKSIEAAAAIVGRVFDSRSSFSADTFAAFITGDAEAGTKRLLEEGMRMLAGALGANIEDFSKEELDNLTEQLEKAFNDGLGFEIVRAGTKQFVREELPVLIQKLAEGTGIPIEYPEDIEKFLTGDYRGAIEHWSAAMWEQFANKYLPEDGQLTYEELRSAVDLSDLTAISGAAVALYNEQTGGALTVEQFNSLPDSQKKVYQDSARRQLMQQSRDSAKYKISDAFLLQAGVTIPKDFSKVMMSGSDQERLAMMTEAVFLHLDPELKNLIPGYEDGMLQQLFNGELSASQVDAVVGAAISQLNINLGPFSSDFVKSFYQFVRNGDRQDFFSNDQYSNMWSYLDSWFGNTLGIEGLPDNFAKSIYYSSQNGFSLDKELTVNGTTVVPSLESMGRDFVFSKITGWADDALGLPPGSAYQFYQAVTAVAEASQALTAAHAAAQGVNVAANALTGVTGVGDQLVANAQSSLAQAQSGLTVLAITTLLNLCEACQAFFGSIDKAISAPPGFTNMLAAGAIASAFGLGIAGLIAAALYFAFGTYRVDYLCPIPPPDWFSLTQFDETYDQLDYDYKNFYTSQDQEIATSPIPGVDKTTWSWEKRLGVRFVNGNDPELWMAWSRYFTGKLLDSTVNFAVLQDSFSKPLQVITYRQANVEFFAPLSEAAFGPEEKGNERLGLGFSQKSTKTTDWVHASFGGFF